MSVCVCVLLPHQGQRHEITVDTASKCLSWLLLLLFLSRSFLVAPSYAHTHTHGFIRGHSNLWISFVSQLDCIHTSTSLQTCCSSTETTHWAKKSCDCLQNSSLLISASIRNEFKFIYILDFNESANSWSTIFPGTLFTGSVIKLVALICS